MSGNVAFIPRSGDAAAAGVSYNGGMKTKHLSAVLLLPCAAVAAIAASGERVTSLDGEWQFARDGGAFAAVEVPHDWAIAGPFDRGGSSATGKLPWKGVGIYRRT